MCARAGRLEAGQGPDEVLDVRLAGPVVTSAANTWHLVRGIALLGKRTRGATMILRTAVEAVAVLRRQLLVPEGAQGTLLASNPGRKAPAGKLLVALALSTAPRAPIGAAGVALVRLVRLDGILPDAVVNTLSSCSCPS